MSKPAARCPKGKEQIFNFWHLMIQVLKQLDPRRLEYWEFDSVVEKAVALDVTKGWDPEETYNLLPKLVPYLCRTTMDTNDMMFLHMRLRIQLEQYDKEILEKERYLNIETDCKDYVIKWSTKVEEKKEEAVGEKKDGNSMEKSKIDSVDEKKTYCDDKKTLTGGEKNLEREKRKAKMGRGSGYTKEEDQKLIAYVYQKIKHSCDFGYQCSKLASAKDWEELASEMVDKNDKSLEQRFRRQEKGSGDSTMWIQKKILVVGKQLGVIMSDEVQKAFEEKHRIRIEMSESKIVGWRQRNYN
ncbi:unnamed protein product [Caenorhabditis brenneri]